MTSLSISAIFYIYLLHGVSSRPTHQLTTEVAVPENITALNSATNVTRTVNETDIDGYVNLEGPVQDSWVEDPKGEPEPNTDTTSAATAAVTTGSPTPPPIAVTIDAELMGQVLMSLNDARQEASCALENYVSTQKADRKLLDYTNNWWSINYLKSFECIENITRQRRCQITCWI